MLFRLIDVVVNLDLFPTLRVFVVSFFTWWIVGPITALRHLFHPSNRRLGPVMSRLVILLGWLVSFGLGAGLGWVNATKVISTLGWNLPWLPEWAPIVGTFFVLSFLGGLLETFKYHIGPVVMNRSVFDYAESFPAVNALYFALIGFSLATLQFASTTFGGI